MFKSDSGVLCGNSLFLAKSVTHPPTGGVKSNVLHSYGLYARGIYWCLEHRARNEYSTQLTLQHAVLVSLTADWFDCTWKETFLDLGFVELGLEQSACSCYQYTCT